MHEQLGVEDDPLAHLIRLLSAEDQAGGESGRLYRQSLEQAFVARFLHVAGSEGVAAPGVSPLPIPALRRLIEKFEGEYERNLSLDELAKEAGYSRSHFQKMFREATGKSAFAYLRDLRLEKARLALEETDDDIASIAARVGFSSHSHLTKLFARRFGVSPSRYRRER
jgi:AraC family transcriptional regulator